jgi:hypothetical protein
VERSKGRTRPSLVRSSDLIPAETDWKPIDAPTPDGRFAVGNRAARAARFSDEDKHFNFLYPPEVLALLGNRVIALGRRVLYLPPTTLGGGRGRSTRLSGAASIGPMAPCPS